MTTGLLASAKSGSFPNPKKSCSFRSSAYNEYMNTTNQQGAANMAKELFVKGLSVKTVRVWDEVKQHMREHNLNHAFAVDHDTGATYNLSYRKISDRLIKSRAN